MAKEKEKGKDVEQLPTGDVDSAESGNVVNERWFVEEYFPPRVDPTTGLTMPEQWNRNYSEEFATEAEANSYIAKHVPDYEGGKFRKAHEVQREVVVLQWFPA